MPTGVVWQVLSEYRSATVVYESDVPVLQDVLGKKCSVVGRVLCVETSWASNGTSANASACILFNECAGFATTRTSCDGSGHAAGEEAFCTCACRIVGMLLFRMCRRFGKHNHIVRESGIGKSRLLLSDGRDFLSPASFGSGPRSKKVLLFFDSQTYSFDPAQPC